MVSSFLAKHHLYSFIVTSDELTAEFLNSYIVDMESVRVTEDQPALRFRDYYYFIWGLAYSNANVDYY